MASLACCPESRAAIAASTARIAVLNATHEIQTASLCSARCRTCSCKCSRGTSASSISITCDARASLQERICGHGLLVATLALILSLSLRRGELLVDDCNNHFNTGIDKSQYNSLIQHRNPVNKAPTPTLTCQICRKQTSPHNAMNAELI